MFKFSEVNQDLFSVDSDYYLAHCISADFVLGAGIAVEFNKRFDMRNKLISEFGSGWLCDGEYQHGCILIENVFNLVTKDKSWQKPTLSSLEDSLFKMKELAKMNNIKKIAMPEIGCGLDRLQWTDVREILHKIFENEDIELLVCCV